MIKREVYMNGTHRNTGCQVHTPKCSPGAHWNKQFNLRVDTPPCCMEKMLHVFRTVTHDLKAYNISHMVFGGAVLGYARNQQVTSFRGAGVIRAVLKRKYHVFDKFLFLFRNLIYCILGMYPFFLIIFLWRMSPLKKRKCRPFYILHFETSVKRAGVKLGPGYKVPYNKVHILLSSQQFVPYDNDLDLWMNGTFWDSQLFTQIRHNWTAVHGFAQVGSTFLRVRNYVGRKFGRD